MPTRNKETSSKAAVASAGSSRLLRWLFLLVFAAAVLPSLLTVSGQHGAVLKRLSPELGQAVSYATVSTHWWAPLEIRDIRVADLSESKRDRERTVPLVTAAKISTEQPLWKLLLSGGRGAEITVEQPVVNLRLVDNETNLERAVRTLFGAGGDSTTNESFPVAVNVRNGTVKLLKSGFEDSNSETPYTTIDGIDGRLSTLDASVIIPEVRLVARVGGGQTRNDVAKNRGNGMNPRIAASLDELAGDFALLPFSKEQVTALRDNDSAQTLKLEITPKDDATDARSISVEASKLDLSELQPVIERLMPGTSCAGEVSCLVQAKLLGHDGDNGMAGRVQLLGDKLRFRHSDWAIGESVVMDSVTAQGAVAIADDGILLKSVRVRSGLVDVAGSGEVRSTGEESDVNSEASVRLNARFDIASLTQMLPQTLKMNSDVKLDSADVVVSCRVERSQEEAVSIAALQESSVGFHWQLAAESSPIQATRQGRPLNIDTKLRVDADGVLDTNNVRLKSAKLRGDFGSLLVAPSDAGVAVQGKINPEQLWNQLRSVVDVPRPGISGVVTVDTHVVMRPDELRLSEIQLRSNELTAQSNGISIFPNRSVLEMFDGGLSVEGSAAAIKTLMAPWQSLDWLADNATVGLKLIADPTKSLIVTGAIRPENGRRSAPPADESIIIDQARFDASVAIDAENHGFVIERCQVQVPGLDATMSGTLSLQQEVLVANLTADAHYDLGELTQELFDGPSGIRFTGSGHERYEITGAPALWSTGAVEDHFRRIGITKNASNVTPLNVTGRIGWERGNLYQLDVGPGAVIAEMREGIIRTEPVRCELGSGAMNVMPAWDLNHNVLQLAPGSRIENLQLTPEFCDTWVGYVAPMLTDSARISGNVSCRADHFEYWIDEPNHSTVQATLTVHNATASPGQTLMPLLQVIEVIGKKQLTSRQISFPAQDVPFEMRNGMVMHDQLRFGVAGYNVASSGGVATDGRVQLNLEIPTERSTVDRPGRSVNLPVTGTIDQPRINTGQLLQNIGRQKIEEKVNDKINKGLKGLLDKLR